MLPPFLPKPLSWSSRSPTTYVPILIPVPPSTTKAIHLDGNNDPSASQTIKQKWSGLSHTTKLAIEASVGGVLALFALVFAFCCVKQRRAGKRERILADAEFEKNANEVLSYRAAMAGQKMPLVGVSEQQMGGQGRQGGGMAGRVRNSWVFGGQKGFQRF